MRHSTVYILFQHKIIQHNILSSVIYYEEKKLPKMHKQISHFVATLWAIMHSTYHYILMFLNVPHWRQNASKTTKSRKLAILYYVTETSTTFLLIFIMKC
jgi:hypothetical protein